VQRPARVDPDDAADAGREQDLGHRHAGRAEADDHHVQVLHALAHELERVEQRGEHHDRRAVLVVVEDRDLELGPQPLLDLEAARGRDVLEVHAAEAGRDRLHRGHDRVGVLGVQADRERVDARELLEQHRLALHHGQGRRRPDVAQAEDRGAVGDHGHGVALDRVLEGLDRVFGDRTAHARDAGGVGHREVVARLERVLVAQLDLAADVDQQRPVGGVDHVRAVDALDRAQDLIPVALVTGRDRDVAQHRAVLEGHEVDRSDRPAGASDRRRHPPQHPGPVGDLHADGEAELSRGRDGHGLTPIIEFRLWRQTARSSS
jgi:hypothetical protein